MPATMKHHPEQQDDEIYMGNTTLPIQSDWRTKRFGTRVFYVDGREVQDSGMFPWFIKVSEIQSVIDQNKHSRGPNWEEKVKIFQEMVDKKTIF